MGSMADLLKTLNDSDQGLVELTDEDLVRLGEHLRDKIDTYKYMFEKFDGEIARHAARITELQERKRALEANKERLSSYLLYHMKEFGFEKLSGEDYVVKLQNRTDVELLMERDPEEFDLRSNPMFVHQKLSWNKMALKEFVKSGEPTSAQYGKITTKPHLRWTTK